MFSAAATATILLAAACAGSSSEERSSDQPTTEAPPTTTADSNSDSDERTTTTETESETSENLIEVKPLPPEFDVEHTIDAVEALATQTGASVVVAQATGAVIARVDGEILTIPLEERSADRSNVWSDGDFVYVSMASDSPEENAPPSTTVWPLTGEPSCEVDGWVHHAVIDSDGIVIVAIDFGDAAEALNCETRERQPIEPFRRFDGETETRSTERIGNRTFDVLGDAEGNADVFNESGMSINGEDYAGFHEFTADASIVTYGDYTQSASPHVTQVITTRDTTTGELLWSLDLGSLFWTINHGDDRLFVTYPVDENAFFGGVETTRLVTIHSVDDGGEIGRADTALNLIYLGDE